MSLARLELGNTCICSVLSSASLRQVGHHALTAVLRTKTILPVSVIVAKLLLDLRACACRVNAQQWAGYVRAASSSSRKKKKKRLLAPNASHAGCVVLRQFLTRCVITLAERSLVRSLASYGPTACLGIYSVVVKILVSSWNCVYACVCGWLSDVIEFYGLKSEPFASMTDQQ